MSRQTANIHGRAGEHAIRRILEDSTNLSQRKLDEWDRQAARVAAMPEGADRRRAEKCLQIELEQIRHNVGAVSRMTAAQK